MLIAGKYEAIAETTKDKKNYNHSEFQFRTYKKRKSENEHESTCNPTN
jgi:hypothetical protein